MHRKIRGFFIQRKVTCFIFFDPHIVVHDSVKVVRKRKCLTFEALYIRLESSKTVVCGLKKSL